MQRLRPAQWPVCSRPVLGADCSPRSIPRRPHPALRSSPETLLCRDARRASSRWRCRQAVWGFASLCGTRSPVDVALRRVTLCSSHSPSSTVIACPSRLPDCMRERGSIAPNLAAGGMVLTSRHWPCCPRFAPAVDFYAELPPNLLLCERASRGRPGRMMRRCDVLPRCPKDRRFHRSTTLDARNTLCRAAGCTIRSLQPS